MRLSTGQPYTNHGNGINTADVVGTSRMIVDSHFVVHRTPHRFRFLECVALPSLAEPEWKKCMWFVSGIKGNKTRIGKWLEVYWNGRISKKTETSNAQRKSKRDKTTMWKEEEVEEEEGNKYRHIHTHTKMYRNRRQQRRTMKKVSIFIHKIAVRSISLQIMLVQLMHMPRCFVRTN